MPLSNSALAVYTIILGVLFYCLYLMWITKRIRDMQKFAEKFGLTFQTSLPYFLGIYWLFLYGEVAKLQGTIASHQVQIIDRVMLFWFSSRKRVDLLVFNHDTEIFIDDRVADVDFKKTAIVRYQAWTSITDLTELLVNLQQGIVPNLFPLGTNFFWGIEVKFGKFFSFIGLLLIVTSLIIIFLQIKP